MVVEMDELLANLAVVVSADKKVLEMVMETERNTVSLLVVKWVA